MHYPRANKPDEQKASEEMHSTKIDLVFHINNYYGELISEMRIKGCQIILSISKELLKELLVKYFV
ncbi:hypothetical protein ASG21_04090 [Chryseobacterium sp. Leaf394]|nr:hypothetical protein ASG21_04090 [Chryseobacterium sp. Leaf394]